MDIFITFFEHNVVLVEDPALLVLRREQTLHQTDTVCLQVMKIFRYSSHSAVGKRVGLGNFERAG